MFLCPEILESKDSCKDCNADDICQSLWVNEAKATCQEDQPFQDIGLAVELADHGSGNTGHTNNSCDGRKEDTAKSGSNSQKLR